MLILVSVFILASYFPVFVLLDPSSVSQYMLSIFLIRPRDEILHID